MPLLLLAVVLFGGFIAGIAVLAALLRAVVWLVLLPFRLLFLVIALPLFFLKVVFAGVIFLALAAVLGGLGLALGVGLLVAAATALVPLTIAGLIVWALVRVAERPATA